jgi:hypothetical protein
MDNKKFGAAPVNNKKVWTVPVVTVISLDSARSGGSPPHAHDGTYTRS